MLSIFVSGHLVKEPMQRMSSKGNAYATATLLASTREGDLICNLAVFDADLMALLSSLKRGDTLSAIGQATVGVWTPEGGEPRASVSLTANRLMTVADRKAKPVQRQASASSRPAPVAEPFDDDLDGIPW